VRTIGGALQIELGLMRRPGRTSRRRPRKTIAQSTIWGGLRSCSTASIASGKGRNIMGNNTNERWLSRRELADRFGLPVKTLARCASNGTGPRQARMGRHVRYRLSDVIEWEAAQLEERCEVRLVALMRRERRRGRSPSVRRANTGGVGRGGP
jgi:predicted DNA-binding transcriptional regulator AlpA